MTLQELVLLMLITHLYIHPKLSLEKLKEAFHLIRSLFYFKYFIKFSSIIHFYSYFNVGDFFGLMEVLMTLKNMINNGLAIKKLGWK